MIGVLEEIYEAQKDVVESGDKVKVPLPLGLFDLTKDSLFQYSKPREARRLYILQTYLKEVLEAAYDTKHYFRKDRMIAELLGLAIRYKVEKVQKYV